MKAFFRIGNAPVDVVAIAATLLMVVTVAIQIVGRWLNTPLPWTEEITRFAFIWLVYLGIGIGFRRAESARVTILAFLLPSQARYVLSIFYIVLCGGFFVLMLFAGIDVVRQQVMMTETASTMDLPMWWIGISVPVSAVIGLLGLAEAVIYHFSIINGDLDEVDDKPEAAS
jgi:TRAP-type C4-dicarboxylate transport system permease small subunit